MSDQGSTLISSLFCSQREVNVNLESDFTLMQSTPGPTDSIPGIPNVFWQNRQFDFVAARKKIERNGDFVVLKDRAVTDICPFYFCARDGDFIVIQLRPVDGDRHGRRI